MRAGEELAAGEPAGGAPGSGDDYLPLWSRYRKLLVTAILGVSLITPAAGLIGHSPITAKAAFLILGTVIFVALTCWIVIFPGSPGSQSVPWAWLWVIIALGIALFAVGRVNFLVTLVVAAAACGRFSSTSRPAFLGAATCAAAGLIVAVWKDLGYGNTLAVAAVPAMAAFFAYGAGRRNEMVAMLRRTRAELAIVAVAEERLRIARDLHDLLGHSLSLITLKAELAGRLIQTDAGRAAREIAELESVARRSLSEVRGAVTGYRQPDLEAELAAARQLLSAAGIACQIILPEPLELAPQADALLAWTVREAVTNVVRHSAADRAVIMVRSGHFGVSVEVNDDGSGPSAGEAGAGEAAAGGPGAGGSRPGGAGLAGLAERVSELGGELAAGPIRPRGFRTSVTVPAVAAAPAPGSGSAP